MPIKPTFYNEFDPDWARRLRGLCEFGAIPDGVVSDADIHSLAPSDVERFTQAHFFAGVGGWAEALQLARWPDDVQTWTGSCPCQPFSQAGKRRGFDDDRHVWPAWRGLIRDIRPSVIFGEQVGGSGGVEWFTRVRGDLEALGYAVGACDLPACSIGAPHMRQRLFFMAYSNGAGLERLHEKPRGCNNATQEQEANESRPCGGVGVLGDSEGERRQKAGHLCGGPSIWSPWSDWIVVECADDALRRVPSEPAFQPLAHGIPLHIRVELLRGFGNAIVPQVAATFVRDCMAFFASMGGLTHADQA